MGDMQGAVLGKRRKVVEHGVEILSVLTKCRGSFLALRLTHKIGYLEEKRKLNATIL